MLFCGSAEEDMKTKFSDKVFRVLMILAFALGTVWMPDTNVRAQEPVPVISVYPPNDVMGDGWPYDTILSALVANLTRFMNLIGRGG